MSLNNNTPKQASIVVVMPCYKERRKVLDTLAQIPDFVDQVFCVDDGCPEKTGDHIEQNCFDERVKVLRNPNNMGVGGAMVTGYKEALEYGSDIVVKIDGDGQMDPSLIRQFIAPIVESRADYVKGNRFYLLNNLQQMPHARLIGNAVLSFLNKLSTGYWRVFDPTNGFTAIDSDVLAMLPLDKLNSGYFFESDMLFRLATVRAVVIDIPQKAIYADEVSHLKVSSAIPTHAVKHLDNFVKRIFYTYFLRDFHLASLEWLAGPILFLFGLLFGISSWHESITTDQEATAGTVMLSALPFIVGLQLTLSAIGFDIDNQPRMPLCSLINKRKRPHP